MAVGEPRRIEPDSVLFRAGDPCRGFFVLHEGTLRVTLTAPNGREIVLYRVTLLDRATLQIISEDP